MPRRWRGLALQLFTCCLAAAILLWPISMAGMAAGMSAPQPQGHQHPGPPASGPPASGPPASGPVLRFVRRSLFGPARRARRHASSPRRLRRPTDATLPGVGPGRAAPSSVHPSTITGPARSSRLTDLSRAH